MGRQWMDPLGGASCLRFKNIQAALAQAVKVIRMKNKVNALILGQGLAGTLLSFELLKRGQSLLVMDDGSHLAASRLAAGLISPITGQRTALMWRAGELLEAARAAYAGLEALLGQKFYFPLPIKRFYTDPEQRRRFRARALEEAHAPWLGPEFESGALGGIGIKGGGWLDCAALVAAWRRHLKGLGLLLEIKIDPAKIKFGPGARCEGIEAEKLVCCGGAAEPGGGFFDFLRFQPTKGELLTVEAPGAPEGQILHESHFAIPLGQGRFRIGATYDRLDLSPAPTPQGRALLEASAGRMLGGGLKVLAHEAGIRPNLLRHFPVLGRHPKNADLLIMNGLGSKGALWAPYCGRVMAEAMAGGAEIEKALNVGRFSPYF
jgi:glycine oxidase